MRDEGKLLVAILFTAEVGVDFTFAYLIVALEIPIENDFENYKGRKFDFLVAGKVGLITSL